VWYGWRRCHQIVIVEVGARSDFWKGKCLRGERRQTDHYVTCHIMLQLSRACILHSSPFTTSDQTFSKWPSKGHLLQCAMSQPILMYNREEKERTWIIYIHLHHQKTTSCHKTSSSSERKEEEEEVRPCKPYIETKIFLSISCQVPCDCQAPAQLLNHHEQEREETLLKLWLLLLLML
jgi:hypothetical protein